MIQSDFLYSLGSNLRGTKHVTLFEARSRHLNSLRERPACAFDLCPSCALSVIHNRASCKYIPTVRLLDRSHMGLTEGHGRQVYYSFQMLFTHKGNFNARACQKVKRLTSQFRYNFIIILLI